MNYTLIGVSRVMARKPISGIAFNYTREHHQTFNTNIQESMRVKKTNEAWELGIELRSY